VIRAAIAVGALIDLALVRLLPETGAFVYPRLAAATIVLLVPGGLIAEALGRRSASATLLWSLGALTAALGPVFVLGLSLDVALALLAVISIVALAACLRRRLPRPPRIGGSAIVAAAGVLYGLVLWHVAGHVVGDGLFHLARVRKLVAFDELSLDAVNEFADGGLHPGYAFPLWHGFLACVARLAAVDPELVVLHEASVLAPLAFLVVYEAGTTLFRSAWLGGAVLTGNLGIVSLAAGHGGAYVSLALPATASRQLLVPAVLTLVFAYLHEPSRAALAALACGGLTLTLIHATDAVFLAVPLGGFLLVRALFDRADARRLLTALAAFLVSTAAVIVALLPVVLDTASHAPGATELDRALRLYSGQLDFVADGGYRLAPDMLSRSGPVAIAALALVPLVGLSVRRRWASFALGGSLAVLLLMLVPTFFEALADAVSLSQARRAAGFLPFAFAFAGGWAVLARLLGLAALPLALVAGIWLQLAYPGDFTLRLDRGGGPAALAWFALLGAVAALVVGVRLPRHPPDRRRVLGALAALVFVAPVALNATTKWTPSESRRPSALTPGLVEALRERVPEGAVVFSDLETSYRIAAAAPVYVAANPPAHVADTEDNLPYERRDDVKRFLRTGDLAIPEQYGYDYLVVDRLRFQLELPLPVVYRDERYTLYRAPQAPG
jgi:hypothetical protein